MTPDWDDAFANMAHVPGSAALPGFWAARAADYRARLGESLREISYGAGERRRLDLILPEGRPEGLAVFIHGGFWLAFGKSDWTHLAEGARARGWAVALPGYTLAPEASVSIMTREIGEALGAAAALVEGPLRLAGHSAGGHLATRMICDDSPLSADVLARVEKVVSISGLHDLRPLRRTKMNERLRLTPEEAASESPVLRRPLGSPRLTCWVGAAERPEFLRQSRLMAMIWAGLDARTDLVEEPERNHFNILEGLEHPDSPLLRALFESLPA
ncbi:alpha/beta hydrolase [Neomegalonema sp.]|uniref:alpha/beta hydrolase n=1 Tax=Neomegalonema sp. TaxID=2039713 RepID=UPI00260A496C|nr:alpha/beta hydrolase [Neomegalonema sp.]MDD2868534.1 alpha/beta hydrolase [Neomegalonema sp.]